MTNLNTQAFLSNGPQTCALTDLTDLPRVGFRGSDSAGYLQAHGYHLPSLPNQALRQDDGGWVARLSASEYLLLGSLSCVALTCVQRRFRSVPWRSHRRRGST